MPQRSRWALPATVDPATSRCFMITIPNDVNYIAAFKGALYDLVKPYAWGDDDDHTALAVGARMLTAWLSITEVDCSGMTIEFRQDECGLFFTLDGWVTETQIYDGIACIESPAGVAAISAIAGDVIDARIADGTIQGGSGQPGPQPRPIQAECHTYHARLAPGSFWQLPSVVNAGDTVHVTNVSGGWSIGELAWYCPEGSRYLLGQCDDQLKTHVSGDQLNPDAYHMQLIGLVGTTYFNPLTATYTIPSGYANQALYFLANTGLTGAPSGEATFDVEVCTGYWEHTFDFITSDEGWVGYAYGGNYVLGVGWCQVAQTPPATGVGIAIQWEMLIGDYRNIAVEIEVSGVGSTTFWGCQMDAGNMWPNTDPLITEIKQSQDNERIVIETGHFIQINPASTQNGATLTIKRVTIRGAGTNPFG